jgi:glutamyl/glutaminyl-tRNA synthetase
LLHDAQGQKLSKSAGSLSLKAMREGGVTREAFYIRMSGLINAPVVCTSLHELLESGVELL